MNITLYLNLFIFLMPFNYPAQILTNFEQNLISEKVKNDDFTSLVSLSSFSAELIDDTVLLSWINIDASPQTLERSYDGNKWISTTTFYRGTAMNEYNIMLDYPDSVNKKVYYRVKILVDGVLQYSPVRLVELPGQSLDIVIID